MLLTILLHSIGGCMMIVSGIDFFHVSLQGAIIGFVLSIIGPVIRLSKNFIPMEPYNIL